MEFLLGVPRCRPTTDPELAVVLEGVHLMEGLVALTEDNTSRSLCFILYAVNVCPRDGAKITSVLSEIIEITCFVAIFNIIFKCCLLLEVGLSCSSISSNLEPISHGLHDLSIIFYGL